MSKIYSNKVKTILENRDFSSLKILLEEDEDTSSNDNENIDEPEDSGPEDTGSEDTGSEDSSFEFPADDDEDSGEDELEGDQDNIDKKSIDNPANLNQLEKLLKTSIEDLEKRVVDVTDSLSAAQQPDSQVDDYLSNINYDDSLLDDEYFQEDYENEDLENEDYENIMVAGYQRKSIKNFLSETKEKEDHVKQKKFDDIEEQIEKLDYLTDLLDTKFNRSTDQVSNDDLPDIVDKSIQLIRSHDPVEYAFNETIKYLNVKAKKNLKDRIIEDFKLMFNEKCKKEGYDTSSITGIGNIDNIGFNTGVTGKES